ncbi:MAG TPA: RNA-binding protein [Candidatus Solibacter sp.]|nr:RNA-binding protein [Candidatus Solibacter sp.]
MKSLFVGNLNFQTSEADLRALFEPFGEIQRVHMATDRETGRARGFAFVEMASDEAAGKAIAALDGKEVAGRNLKVNEARPRAERGAPRGPSRGSGGGGGRGRGRDNFSNENYGEAARQPREPRW